MNAKRTIGRQMMFCPARLVGIALHAILPAIALLNAAPAGGASCESIASLNLPITTITSAQSVAPGALELSGGESGGRLAGAVKDLPGFCRVATTLTPSSDSDIKVEVWMPSSGWNGKYEAVGNPGWAGSINYFDLAQALKHGYASSSTDTGHAGSGGSFALGHPEKLIDFGYRSEHEMAVRAKAIIAAFYGSAPKLSYFVGCSSGGRQALMEAQRFPNDFDGIVAGAPTNNWTNMMFGRIWIAQATLKDAGTYIPPAKYPIIHKAVLEACDALDGVKDDLISDPTQCHFDPQVLTCKDSDAADCLTMPQMAAARKIYASVKNPLTGQAIFPGMEPGSELVWATLAGGPRPIALADDHFKYVIFQDANWDFKTLNFGTDLTKAEKADNGILSATNPDLRPFVSHGGKLIQYHGWTDQQVQPLNSVNYYDVAVKTLGGTAKAMDSYRLFMAPGMNHCRGGEGPNSFDMTSALEQWVEKGKAPDQIVASHTTNGMVDRTRPLCPYPQVARYAGSGSTDEAANFTCVQNK